MLSWSLALAALASVILPCRGDYTVTIYPQILSQNGRTRFETDRWNGHSALDGSSYISGNKVIGSRTGRWLFPDLHGDIFLNAPENPYRKGYADPSYFNNPTIQQKLCSVYLENLNGYGSDHDIVMVLSGQVWPKWMNTSLHHGGFPNNFDAAAELVVLLIDSVNKYTHGKIPKFLEVMNEADSLWPAMTWDTMIPFHKTVSQKLHAKYPELKVGGPAQSEAIGDVEHLGFVSWRHVRDFLDMSLAQLDFYSFHPYNILNGRGGEHSFHGTNEARLVGVIDMLQSYSHSVKGKSVPLILSEYGLGRRYIDSQTPGSLIQWAYIYQQNSYRFTYMNHRGVVEQAVSLLQSHAEDRNGNASIFQPNGTETHVAKAYRFWKTFSPDDQFLRVESQYDGQERAVSPLAVVNVKSKKVKVLLNNYAKTAVNVHVDFPDGWIQPSAVHETCIYLSDDNVPVLSVGEAVSISGNIFNIRPESTCFFEMPITHTAAPRSIPTVHETTIYSRDIALPHKHMSVAQTTIYLQNAQVVYAQLRFGIVYRRNKPKTKPTELTINGHTVSREYFLYDSDRHFNSNQWDVYIYHVPVNTLRAGNNVIRFQLEERGGYVSTTALIVGRLSGTEGQIVG